jgi:hypothetical protein
VRFSEAAHENAHKDTDNFFVTVAMTWLESEILN